MQRQMATQQCGSTIVWLCLGPLIVFINKALHRSKHMVHTSLGFFVTNIKQQEHLFSTERAFSISTLGKCGWNTMQCKSQVSINMLIEIYYAACLILYIYTFCVKKQCLQYVFQLYMLAVCPAVCYRHQYLNNSTQLSSKLNGILYRHSGSSEDEPQ